ncbi:hypothetical protein HYPSUDRAFT_85343 [Hypholoma sublateritium FD-334 SS-4]|uniref:Integrase core domain-containing protein n=1 Tax=Hypholoma sublateritium (strain FD-334 SS-4) TaxID=945553 RepID=A0A0D2P431_HYPSF|nr:hypothetical protein HYPSUDRAFT_85343 [Hypholoma sublateritium FD-334 SS-4]
MTSLKGLETLNDQLLNYFNSMSNNNPTGINQHIRCPKKGDPVVEALLSEYHRNGNTNRDLVSELLLANHQIQMAPATVARRFRDLNLRCAGSTTRDMPTEDRRQLVLDAMAKDPARRQGPSSVKEAIAFGTGVHLTRQYIREEMRVQDPAGFAEREPSAKKVHRGVLISLGPHHEWSADGHDKLSAIGFPIWGVRDKWSGKWLGLWVVPNNRLKLSVAYLYLKLVSELGGMPIQSTTDCGSETTLIYGLACALREHFAPEMDEAGIGAAHVFLKSIYNITIERGWLRIRLTWGDNVKLFWKAGEGIYNPTIPKQYELVQWLWSKLIQQELDVFVDRQNNHKVRTDNAKMNPSGVSPNVCHSLYTKYGGEDCLQPVDTDVIHQLMADIGGEKLIQFVTPEYAAHAQSIYATLNIQSLAFDNVWLIYSTMLPKM